MTGAQMGKRALPLDFFFFFFFRFGIRNVRVSAEERNERDGMYR